MKAYIWPANNGNASWTVNRCQGHWQGTQLASGKIANCFIIRAGGTGRAGRATARPIFWHILVLFILYTTSTPQNNKIHK